MWKIWKDNWHGKGHCWAVWIKLSRGKLQCCLPVKSAWHPCTTCSQSTLHLPFRLLKCILRGESVWVSELPKSSPLWTHCSGFVGNYWHQSGTAHITSDAKGKYHRGWISWRWLRHSHTQEQEKKCTSKHRNSYFSVIFQKKPSCFDSENLRDFFLVFDGSKHLRSSLQPDWFLFHLLNTFLNTFHSQLDRCQ